ncbi:NAD(P)H-binding protein [Kribbella qitaiheensis]|uniref:NAD(P)H-binding protein n=1 Tax=Kribbella qitaiheensis TaxID=1544730 RepID=A0A7G6X202_9ACTN|nr:NAD(P)H-binding protein [Kribbella qitaiheensis]QNE20267.1 NAD(P)H-binding protein [Kribbella qitaiheensis]
MSKVLVFGAGGRAGRAAVAEARARGHEVTAVVRDPSRYADLPGLVVGDVTSAEDVERLSKGQDAVVAAVYDGASADPAAFFTATAESLVDGLTKAGVPRLVWIGLASILPTESGALLMDTPSYPQEYRAFYLAHAAAAEVFEASSLDWLSIAPAGDFNHPDPTRTGGYRVIPADATNLISYADVAIALLDEIDKPRHHRTKLGVGS